MKQQFIFIAILAFLASCGLDPNEVKTILGPPTNDARDTINVDPEPIEGIQLLTPANTQTHITFDKEVQLNWVSEKLGLNYEVFFWKASEAMPGEPLVSSLQNNFYVITDLEANTQYNWLIKGSDVANSLISDEYTFQTSEEGLKDVFQHKVIGLSFNNSVEDDENAFEIENHFAKFTTDRFGNSNSAFNGTTDGEGTAAIVTYDEKLNPGIMTVSIWVKPTDLANTGWIYSMQRWEGFSMKREGDARIKNMYFHETSNWGAVDFFTDEIAMDKWTNITITADGLVRKVFYNGEKVGEIEALGPVVFNAGIGSNLIIGGQVENNNTNLKEFFTGGIDDFKIFSETLNEDQVKTFFNYESNYNPNL